MYIITSNGAFKQMLSLRSKLTQKVLAYLFLQEQEFYATALARRLQLDRGNLIRKLHELEQEGLLTSEVKGRERYYQLNPSYPLLKEYKTIIHRTVGLEHQLQELLKKIDGLKQVFLFGSYVTDQMDAASDIDLLVVGDQDTLKLQKAIAKLQKDMDREINVISMGVGEFEQRRQNDSFVQGIFKKPTRQLL